MRTEVSSPRRPICGASGGCLSLVRSMLLLLLLSLLLQLSFLPGGHAGQAGQTETCEYDLDLTHNTVKIICQGSPGKVNVYAETATLQADEVTSPIGGQVGEYKKPGNSGSQAKGTTGSRQDDPGSRTRTSGGGSREPSRAGKPEKPGQQDSVPNTRPIPGRQGVPTAVYHTPFAEYVWNATRKLDKAKRQLSTYTDSIRNTTTRLAVGDLKLRDDMKNLKETSNSATELKEGIIAAMRNQYNFIRSTLLARNYELERLVTSLSMLVEVTSDGLHNTLDAHKRVMDEMLQVNTTLLAVRRMVSNELRKRGTRKKGKGDKPKDKCPKDISAIGSGHARQMDSTSGSYMVESYNPNDYRPVYVMKGAGPNDQLLEFDVDADVAYNLVGRYYSLPFFCVGTGHAVFRRHFYCHKSASNRVVKYHLKRMDIVSELVLPGAAWADPAVAGHSDIDLAVDEFGLWALYATHSSAGKLVISKINHRLMEVERTWQTSYPLHLLGKSFLVCGVLYATDSVKDTPTFLRYVYNTETGKEQILEPGDMPFPNFAPLVSPEDGTTTGGSQGQPGWRGKDNSNTSMLSYDFRQSKLFAWNNGRIEAFPIYFKDMP